MRRDHYVFGYDAEPADERPTGFGQTNFGQSGLATLSTLPAPWTVSPHSTFDEPSRALDSVQALRKQRKRLSAGLAAIVLVAIATITAAVLIAMHS